MWVLIYSFLIDFGHDGASFVVILLFDKNRIWVYRTGNRLHFLYNEVTDPHPFHRPGTQGDCR